MYGSLDLIVFLRCCAGILKIEKEEELNGKSKAGRFVRSLFHRASGPCDGCRDLSAGIGNLSLPQRPDGVEGREDYGENDVFNRLHQQDVHHGGRDDAGAGRQAVA